MSERCLIRTRTLAWAEWYYLRKDVKKLRPHKPLAGLGQRIMLPLRQGAGIFRPAPGRQRVQHHGHRGGGGAGQVPGQPPGPADGGLQPHRPVIKPVRAGIGTGAGPLDHLQGQSGQIRQARAAPGGGQQDPVRVRRRTGGGGR
jgi:hypothetical protein